ncbi:DUF4157 domain-containing protein [Mycobacterium sp. CBMA293]|nr:DUF4157 domain-containing protein [Mycolicibacterium sp. CBMA 360]MUL58382.1 DUF4157 domain-containing protein [Mycolicibacterium sp. CBMA 335]MUL73840.1 DUF4157 domain-containing protein [Mycolicibacterium sp. CBMA 311]MUL93265.1 DUF4157 domain-containing protein [Mycolicibacterium sp. CBMA 230]MUM10108.1 DUF4157 domain-containing protein [Mycolicibacterium sp. CBMA 293]MUM31931.1 DUF4157 domain-containing protein [Mycolicibacterium sp. CBMA 361]
MGSRDDACEHEADRAADDVMHAPHPHANTAGLHPDRGITDSARVQAPNLLDHVVSQRGEPLDASTRAFMEPRFGHNFADVRVHRDPTTAASAQAMNADAYTVGSHIGFDAGKYAPSGFAGRRLIAHELAHVVQQSRSPMGAGVVRRQEKSSPSEGDALRTTVHDTAKDALAQQKVIKSEDDIYDIRNGTKTLRMATVLDLELVLRLPGAGTPMKNFTTCIEFGGQTFRDAVKARHQSDPKSALKIIPLYSAVMKMMFHDIELQQSIVAFRNSLDIFAKPARDYDARMKKAAAAQDELSKIAKPDAKQKGQMKQKDLEIGQLAAALKQVNDQTDKLQAKIDAKTTELTNLRAKETAWIRPSPGLTGARPMPGDLVLHGQPPKKSTYGVSASTTVALAPGAFTHIAVLDEIKVVGEGVELWKSIDGGGVSPDARDNFVRTSDLLVFATQPKPDTDAAAAKAVLLGWFDVAKLVGGDESTPSAPTK